MMMTTAMMIQKESSAEVSVLQPFLRHLLFVFARSCLSVEEKS